MPSGRPAEVLVPNMALCRPVLDPDDDNDMLYFGQQRRALEKVVYGVSTVGNKMCLFCTVEECSNRLIKKVTKINGKLRSNALNDITRHFVDSPQQETHGFVGTAPTATEREAHFTQRMNSLKEEIESARSEYDDYHGHDDDGSSSGAASGIGIVAPSVATDAGMHSVPLERSKIGDVAIDGHDGADANADADAGDTLPRVAGGAIDGSSSFITTALDDVEGTVLDDTDVSPDAIRAQFEAHTKEFFEIEARVRGDISQLEKKNQDLLDMLQDEQKKLEVARKELREMSIELGVAKSYNNNAEEAKAQQVEAGPLVNELKQKIDAAKKAKSEDEAKAEQLAEDPERRNGEAKRAAREPKRKMDTSNEHRSAETDDSAESIADEETPPAKRANTGSNFNLASAMKHSPLLGAIPTKLAEIGRNVSSYFVTGQNFDLITRFFLLYAIPEGAQVLDLHHGKGNFYNSAIRGRYKIVGRDKFKNREHISGEHPNILTMEDLESPEHHQAYEVVGGDPPYSISQNGHNALNCDLQKSGSFMSKNDAYGVAQTFTEFNIISFYYEFFLDAKRFMKPDGYAFVKSQNSNNMMITCLVDEIALACGFVPLDPLYLIKPCQGEKQNRRNLSTLSVYKLASSADSNIHSLFQAEVALWKRVEKGSEEQRQERAQILKRIQARSEKDFQRQAVEAQAQHDAAMTVLVSVVGYVDEKIFSSKSTVKQREDFIDLVFGGLQGNKKAITTLKDMFGNGYVGEEKIERFRKNAKLLRSGRSYNPREDIRSFFCSS